MQWRLPMCVHVCVCVCLCVDVCVMCVLGWSGLGERSPMVARSGVFNLRFDHKLKWLLTSNT